jgi:glutamate carboxypeptidase
MEHNATMIRTFNQAQQLAASIGLTLEEGSTGGGSDGNFTSALGTPTLDGMGAVGDGAHAAHEHILISSLADRAALLATILTQWED